MISPLRSSVPILVAILTAATQARAAPTYSLTNLGSLGGPTTIAYGLNNLGQVAGSSLTADGHTHAFLWQNGPGMMDLATLPGNDASVALAVNNAGTVLGVSFDRPSDAPTYQPFVWNAASGFTPAGTPANWFLVINDAGVVAGTLSTGDSGQTIGVTWTSTSGLAPVSAAGISVAQVVAVNNTGQMVVRSDGGLDFLRQPDGTLSQLFGRSGIAGAAWAMNDAGEIAGLAIAGIGEAHATLWDTTATPHDLTPLSDDFSLAVSINSAGDVVGQEMSGPDGYNTGFLYTDNQTYALSDLFTDAPNWQRITVVAINDSGQIAGWGTHDGQTESFLLTPDSASLSAIIPEPATATLLLLATLPIFQRNKPRHPAR